MLSSIDWTFDQPVTHDLITYADIPSIATGQGDNYTICCLLDYDCFEKYYMMITIDLSKQQILDANPKAIQKN